MSTMIESQLGKKLAEMYNNAHGDKSIMALLFGVLYADEIIESGANKNEIIKCAEINVPYAHELYKGIKLSKYVTKK